jgi:hypothetical protein
VQSCGLHVLKMGCAGSTPKDPSSVLVAQLSDLDSPPLAQGARATTSFLELQTKAVKGSTLSPATGGKPLKAPSVTAFEKVGGGARPLLQALTDIPWTSTSDATFTLFDESESAVAVYSCNGSRVALDNGPGAVLYARDAPDMSNGKSVLETSADSQGQVFSTAPASKEVANGVLMRAVGRLKMIHKVAGGGDYLLGYGLCLLGADGAFHSKADLFYDQNDVFFQHVKNQRGEVVAYRTVTGKQYYVAAGVDAVPVIALMQLAQIANNLRSGFSGPAAGGGGGGA